MDLKTWIDQEIGPCIRADGGWIELSREEAGVAEVTVRGECVRCAALERCLRWVEGRAKEALGREIRITAVREPFLWRRQ